MTILRNRPYDQPANHSFKTIIAAPYAIGDESTAEVSLSDMTGMPLPWRMLENALVLMIRETSPRDLAEAISHEDLTLVDPVTDEEQETVITLTFRASPAGTQTDENGVRTYQGTLEARPAIPAPLSYNYDALATPMTCVWTEIAVPDTEERPMPTIMDWTKG